MRCGGLTLQPRGTVPSDEEEEPDSTPHRPKNAKIYLGRKSHETLREHLMAFDPSSTFWVRGRKNHRFAFKSDFRSNFKSAGCERRKQLAIQHDVHGPGDASPYDCREYQCVRQFGKRRGACQRFELF
jgi:hypothetical protein